MKSVFRFITLVSAAATLLAACQMSTSVDAISEPGTPKTSSASVDWDTVPTNPDPGELGPPPAATVPLIIAKTAEKITPLPIENTKGDAAVLEAYAAALLKPAILTARLKPGESVTEHKTALLPADVRPPMGDILFSFDLTGSMYGELSNLKNNSQNILTAVRALIPDTRFGVVSHMDYPGQFESPGYPLVYYGYPENWLGYGNVADYPYHLDRPLTDITEDAARDAVIGAIQSLVLGTGGDLPESFSRVFFESCSDPAIGWRPGARKIVIAWLDSVPHDPDFAEIYNPDLNITTGADPGRDAVIGTADDLEILPVLQEMAARNMTLIVVYSNSDTPASVPGNLVYNDYWGTGFPLWQAYAAVTGGAAFKINTDGTIPGGTSIDDFVAGLIGEQIGHIGSLSLEVRDPAYSGWLTSVSPAAYGDIELDEDKSFDFDILLTVPPDAEDGPHSFTVALVGDGVVYAEQAVTIEVNGTFEVSFDIKPGSCPNPFNVGSKGVLPAAIAGTADFDVTTIDPASLRLAGVAPIRWNYEDVTSPYEPYTDKPLDENSCALSGPDGIPDLTLKFDAKELAAALGDVEDDEVLAVLLTGESLDGTLIAGEDIIKIIKAGKEKNSYERRFSRWVRRPHSGRYHHCFREFLKRPRSSSPSFFKS